MQSLINIIFQGFFKYLESIFGVNIYNCVICTLISSIVFGVLLILRIIIEFNFVSAKDVSGRYFLDLVD